MTSKYRYRLISTGAGSQKYGPCAGCGEDPVEDIYVGGGDRDA